MKALDGGGGLDGKAGTWVANLPRLASLKMDETWANAEFYENAARSTTVTYVTLLNARGDASAASGLCRLKNLESLNLRHMPFGSMWENEIPGAKTLNSLTLVSCQLGPTTTMDFILRSPQLRNLGIYNCSFDTGNSSAIAFEPLTQARHLSELDMAGQPGITNDMYETLQRELPDTWVVKPREIETAR